MTEGFVDIERLLENSGWLKSLALGLVRDDASADDLIQETWLAALKTPPKHDRTARSWLMRVVRNLANRTNRDHARRIRRERAAAKSEDVGSSPEQLLQRAELQRDIAMGVVGLKEPLRTTILLRFFEGLSAREISLRQEVPITTVKSRLAKGLQQLRIRLDRRYGGDRRAWCSILIPFVGLRAMTSPSIDGVEALGVDAQLAAAPTTSLAKGALSSLALGGAIMTQKAVITTTIGVAALSATALAVVITSSASNGRPEAPPEEIRHVSVSEHENLRKQYASTVARLKGAEERLAEIARENRGKTPDDGLVASVQDEGNSGEPAKANSDWSAMGKLIGENVDVVLEALRHAEEGSPYPDELKKKLARFGSQLVLYGFRVRSLSRFPYLDRDFYDEMLTGIAKEALGLSARQSQHLSTSVQVAFDELLGDADPADLLPLERHWLRSELSFRTHETVVELLEKDELKDGELLDNWRTLRRLSEKGPAMLLGSPPVKEYGLRATDVEREILADWQHDYSLTDLQVEAERESAAEYARRAHETVARFGATQGEIESLTPDLRLELRRELLEMQLQEELRLVSSLNESQREAIAQKRPTIRRFGLGIESTVTNPSLLRDLDRLLGK